MRNLIILRVVFAIGICAWFLLREDGVVEQVTQARIETALIQTGAPPEFAACMAGRMVDRLSLNQLRKLERIRADDGESVIPLSPGQVLERIRRVDDPEAIEITTRAAAGCALGSFLN
jgi:hypothetical protein